MLEDSVIGVARNSVFGVKACAINTTDSAFSVAKMTMVVFVAWSDFGLLHRENTGPVFGLMVVVKQNILIVLVYLLCFIQTLKSLC